MLSLLEDGNWEIIAERSLMFVLIKQKIRDEVIINHLGNDRLHPLLSLTSTVISCLAASVAYIVTTLC